MTPDFSASSRFRLALDTLATVAIVAASLALVWKAYHPVQITVESSNPRKPPVPAEKIALGNSPTMGKSDARVGMILFSEFECPYCAEFSVSTLPHLKERFVTPGVLRIIFRHFPLERVHPAARGAAETAVCADRQGKFWDVHDAFFSDPQMKTPSRSYPGIAAKVGLNQAELSHCLGVGEPGLRVTEDIELGRRLRVASTPAFLLGNIEDGQLIVKEVILGAQPLSAFDAAIQKFSR